MKTDFQHKHNVVYYGKCPNEGYKDGYFGETKGRIVERVIDHRTRSGDSQIS